MHLERDSGQIHVGKRRNEARQETTFQLVSIDIRNEGLACRGRWFERHVSSGRLDGVVAKFYCQKDHQRQLLPAFKLWGGIVATFAAYMLVLDQASSY